MDTKQARASAARTVEKAINVHPRRLFDLLETTIVTETQNGHSIRFERVELRSAKRTK